MESRAAHTHPRNTQVPPPGCKAGCECICSLPSFGPGIFWVLLEVLRIVFGIDICPHSIIPVTWKQEYPCSDATIINIDTMFAIKVGTIYIPIHQLPTAAVNDTADLLIGHRDTLSILSPVYYLSSTCQAKRSKFPGI